MGHLFKLCEDQDLLSFFVDGTADFMKPLKLTTLFFFKPPGSQVLVGMIADLFEFHERRKDQAFSLDPICFLDGFSNILDQLSI